MNPFHADNAGQVIIKNPNPLPHIFTRSSPPPTADELQKPSVSKLTCVGFTIAGGISLYCSFELLKLGIAVPGGVLGMFGMLLVSSGSIGVFCASD